MIQVPLAELIIQRIKQAAEQYYRLVLVVAPSGSGKTYALQEVRANIEASLVNVNLELSKRMLDLTERQRKLQLPVLMKEIVNNDSNEMILLDNLELMFDVNLGHDPLKLLQNLSRNKTVVAAWNGTIVDDFLIYAAPNHPEYQRYPLRDFLVASQETLK